MIQKDKNLIMDGRTRNAMKKKIRIVETIENAIITNYCLYGTVAVSMVSIRTLLECSRQSFNWMVHHTDLLEMLEEKNIIMVKLGKENYFMLNKVPDKKLEF